MRILRLLQIHNSKQRVSNLYISSRSLFSTSFVFSLLDHKLLKEKRKHHLEAIRQMMAMNEGKKIKETLKMLMTKLFEILGKSLMHLDKQGLQEPRQAGKFDQKTANGIESVKSTFLSKK